MIIDAHVHVGVSVSDRAEAQVSDIERLMQECGIDRSILFPIDTEKPAGTYEKSNDQIIELVKNDPKRYAGLCRLQPRLGTRAVKEFERCWRQGLRGLKLHSHSDQFVPEDCHAIFEAAHQFKSPVVLHTGHASDATPERWRSLFRKYSNINFIMAHASQDLFRLAGQVAAEEPNVFLDTSTLWYRRTQVLLEIAGPHKILYASDYPYSHPVLERKKLELLIHDKKDLQKVMGGNARRIFSL